MEPTPTPAEIAAEYFAALGEHDLDTALSMGHTDMVDDFVAVGELHGRGAVRDFFEEVFSAFPDFDLEAADDTGDLDLMVIPVDDTCSEQTGTELVSATPSAGEQVTLLDPAPGWYVAAVDPYRAPDGGGPLGWRLDVYDLHPELETGTFEVDPDPVPVVAGGTTDVEVRWSGLEPGPRYLGMLAYEGALSPTFVTVDSVP